MYKTVMIEHCRAVRRGAPNTFILVSMPYGSYATPEIGVTNALRLMKEAGTDAVKMQGGREKADIITAIAEAIDRAVGIFTFSIGAGAASCGQLLLGADLLGIFDRSKPKFPKRYAQIAEIAVDALQQFAHEVRAGDFPDEAHSYTMKPQERDKLDQLLREARRTELNS